MEIGTADLTRIERLRGDNHPLFRVWINSIEFTKIGGSYSITMNNYPEHLAPEFEFGGAVATPFEEWWDRVKSQFPRVPKEVAREWLHRHWSHSHFSFLSSNQYEFTKKSHESARLKEILVAREQWIPQNAVLYGKTLYERDLWVGRFMKEHRTFPTPIIALDNSEGWLFEEDECPDWCTPPRQLVLIEGHTRHALGCWMHEIGELVSKVEIWLMHRPHSIFKQDRCSRALIKNGFQELFDLFKELRSHQKTDIELLTGKIQQAQDVLVSESRAQKNAASWLERYSSLSASKFALESQLCSEKTERLHFERLCCMALNLWRPAS